jgi:CDP-6-deoxy-D-xylo-4-hexulose-3-dehydrase
LPEGYDHKYIYSYLGFNLRPLDLQAAIGRQQLKKLSAFGEARKHNWKYLRAGLAGLEEFIDFTLPTHATGWTGKAESGKQPGEVASQRLHGPGKAEMPVSTLNSQLSTFSWDSTGCRTDCSWFGFMLRVKPGAPFTHCQLARHLEEKKIGNRMIFGGNLLRQPVFVQLKKDRPQAFRVVGDLAGSNELMSTALFLGTYPGLTKTMLDYELEVVRAFVRGK